MWPGNLTQEGAQSSSSASSVPPSSSSASSIPLLAVLPREMLQLILEYLGPQAVGNLRKTCGSLANNKFLVEMLLSLAKPMIAVGGFHTLALTAGGKLYAWRANSSGQLGLGDDVNRYTPQPVLNLDGNRIISIAAGWHHSLALAANGDVYAWGDNFRGQLGLGSHVDQNKPQLVPDFVVDGSRIISIAAGWSHSLVLDANGKLYACGDNYFGQLGLGDNVNKYTPQPVPNFVVDGSRIIAIAAGGHHNLALAADGRVYAWGANFRGQLGLRNNLNQNTPQLVPDFVGGSRIIAIAAGYDHSLALDANGRVYAWGYNYFGQLGLGHGDNKNTPQLVPNLAVGNRIISIVAGYNHTLVLAANGDVYAWGYNDNGQLGLGHNNDQNRPQLVQNFGGSRIIAIAAGGHHNLALAAGGKLYACGDDSFGGLGLGYNVHQKMPRMVGINIAPGLNLLRQRGLLLPLLPKDDEWEIPWDKDPKEISLEYKKGAD